MACVVVAIGGAAIVVELSSGCGSRGPLDDSPFDAAADEGAVEADLLTDAIVADANPASDSGAGDGGIIACGSCLLGTCGQPILGCLGDEGCREILQCVATDCAGASGGALNPSCLLGCAASDPSAAFQVLELFQCVSGKCGPDCTSLLTGIGGGGGGRDGGRRDGGPPPDSGPDGG